MILGIDFGSSNIDAVLFDEKKEEIILKKSFFSDLKKINLNSFFKEFSLNKISSINVTGYGAKFFPETFKEIPIKKISEIDAIAFGAAFLSKQEEFLAASLGSGTCLVSFKNNKASHCGGSAVGGRTLLGLSKLLLNTNSFQEISLLARKGKLERIDLLVEDLYPEGIGLLDRKTTAAHFGKLSEKHKKQYCKEDIALALLNLIAQSAGGTAAFAALAHSHKKIVFTGKLAENKTIQEIIRRRISILDKELEFIFPKNAGIATAIGAAFA